MTAIRIIKMDGKKHTGSTTRPLAPKPPIPKPETSENPNKTK